MYKFHIMQDHIIYRHLSDCKTIIEILNEKEGGGGWRIESMTIFVSIIFNSSLHSSLYIHHYISLFKFAESYHIIMIKLNLA